MLFVAFKNPDNSVVLVLMNPTDNNVEHKIMLGDKAYNINSLAKSISSIILQ
jgi:O-glycosyl hydrolase